MVSCFCFLLSLKNTTSYGFRFHYTLDPLVMFKLTQDWWDVSRQGEVRTWSGPIPSPFKVNKVSPLRSIPGCDTPDCIRPDLMHCFNIGIGGDLTSSGLFAACQMGLFRDDPWGKVTDKSLDRAHDLFWYLVSFQQENGFHQIFWEEALQSQDESWWGLCTLGVLFFRPWPPLKPHFRFSTGPPRKYDFPQGTGRAHDTALVCKWLAWQLNQLDPTYDVESYMTALVFFSGLSHILTWGTISIVFLAMFGSTLFQQIWEKQDAGDIELFELLKFTLNEANKFFSGLYREGVFIEDRGKAAELFAHGFNHSDFWLQQLES